MQGKTGFSPYFLILRLRSLLYEKGWIKVHSSPVPTVCIGNVTVGGTGKTPHTEMIARMLQGSEEWRGKNIAILSRGFGRRSRGFQQVPPGGSACLFGDEPVQMKNNLPGVTVALDKDRVEGCELLCHPETVRASRRHSGCLDKEFPAADVIVLDDAFQYRRLKADLDILLIDYNRPVREDRPLPLGRLRDFPERVAEADIVIVTKCPYYLEDRDREEWKSKAGLREGQKVFFTNIVHGALTPVYAESCDIRYVYSKQAILFTAIANDTPLKMHLSDNYKIVKHFRLPDHHRFTHRDISRLASAAGRSPMAAICTTEKDAQRVLDCDVPQDVREKMFRIPVSVGFFSEKEERDFREALLAGIRR